MPYFGKFNNYFPLFLKSCGLNKDFHWLIITDDKSPYHYPENVQVIFLEFFKLRRQIQEKFDFPIFLDYAYKLCDFRPAYGYIFEEYISQYQYWGYCDCDLIFGNLDRLLTPLLEQNFDKLFASGHMTIFRNTRENNRRFFENCGEKSFYRKALSSPEGCWFDEDCYDENIHTIFLNAQAKVYTKNMALNTAVDYSQFYLAPYVDHIFKFQVMPYERALYVWNRGELEKTTQDENKCLKTEAYLYMHFQLRYMKCPEDVLSAPIFQIYPNGFREMKAYPVTSEQWRHLTRRAFNLHYFRRKWSNLSKRLRNRKWKEKKA